MKSKREEALVGLFVCVATLLLIVTILAVSGTFSSGNVPYHTFFKSAGGLLPGAMVRYAGMNAGKVKRVRVDPADSTRIEIDFSVQRDTPVKTDSTAKITALGALSDNYVEVGTGTKGAALAPPGSELKSVETLTIADLSDMIGGLEPIAKQVLDNLNERLAELQVTTTRVNDLLNDKNRANVGGSLGNLNAMLADSRPKVSASLTNVQNVTAQLQPLLDNLKVATNQANAVLSHVDSVVVENREDIRAIVVKLKETLTAASALTDQLKSTAINNSENIDQTLINIRVTTENVRQLTDSLRSNPSLLIRGGSGKDRKPGELVK
jgi:phospholipid/cholesterol/gamma-HCH transport system substrate-binding protein